MRFPLCGPVAGWLKPNTVRLLMMMMMRRRRRRFDSISFVAPLFRDKTLNLMFAVLSTNQTTNVGKP